MSEITTRAMRAVSTTSPDGLLAPSENPLDTTHRRSGSLAPSFRSTSTSIEEKEHITEFGNFSRRETFKISQKPSLWAWFKGLFNREKFMRDLEETIKVVQESAPQMSRTKFLFNVLVSTKSESTRYETARCLLDTGCLSGNLVTREFVERLGYVESDFQEPTPLESQGGRTFTNEHFNIEAAVLLSWHHSTSSVLFRRMRFLVVSSSNFEMIIGADAIARHSLLISPVFTATTERNAKHVTADDPRVLEPNVAHAKWRSTVQNSEHALKKEKKKPEAEQNAAKIKEINERLLWERHVLKVLKHRLDAAKFLENGDGANEHKQERLAKEEMTKWDEKHPSRKSDGPCASGTGGGSPPTKHQPVKGGSGHSK